MQRGLKPIKLNSFEGRREGEEINKNTHANLNTCLVEFNSIFGMASLINILSVILEFIFF